MPGLRTTGKILLGLAALPVAAALLSGIPLGAYALVSFLFKEAMFGFFVPAFAIYTFGVCGALGAYHLARRASGAASGRFSMPGVVWLAGGAVAAILVGQVLLAGRNASFFWLFFLMAAALPPLAALALANQRLGPVTTWRRTAAGIVSGSVLSTHIAILLGGSVSILVYSLVQPLRDIVAHAVASSNLERMFYSPTFMILIVEVAIVAPVVEELTKPLAVMVLARRLQGPAEAFLVGMAGGVGFAILENMLYEAAGAGAWASIATLRGVGGALHPLNAGLVALGWYGVRNGLPGAWRRLVGFYGVAVGIHALWNGGLVVLYSGIGAYFFGADTWSFSVYGVAQPGVVIVLMVLEAIVLWRVLVVVTEHLRDPSQPGVPPALALKLAQPRRLALWATALAVVLPVLGALYGPLAGRYVERLMPFG